MHTRALHTDFDVSIVVLCLAVSCPIVGWGSEGSGQTVSSDDHHSFPFPHLSSQRR